MRHQVRGRKLNRDTHERKALFKALINSLVLKGEIKTTETKAKAIRSLVDKLITKGKKGTLNSRRLIGAFLQNKVAVNKIVDEIAPLFKTRKGGYTRMVRLGERRGDDTRMVKLELTEKPEVKKKAPEEVKKETKPVKEEKKPKVKAAPKKVAKKNGSKK